MYLKSIKANGFKSFADKINIMLENNITCIVGPNGSGKSNIVDAIRWVLGEQSVKSLRGTSAMSDVIFMGSASRKEASRAEVSLNFDNQDHYLKSDFTEIEVKRVLYQSGESEYFINNTKVRLKDITDLFLDTGAGASSFNIISQGSVSEVINSKPIDRRSIFEEAAGVLKYKKHKEESIKKLDKTLENIGKVNLVIDELKTTIEPLKEQSENAKTYLELKDKLKNIEVATITDEISHIETKHRTLEQEINDLNQCILKEESDASKESSALEELKLKSMKLEEQINNLNQELLKSINEFKNFQNERLMYQERKKYAENELNIDQNIIHLKEELNAFDRDINLINNEILNLEKELKKEENELRNVDETISLEKIKRNKLQNQLQASTHSFFELNSKKQILENALEQDLKTPVSVKNILNNVRLKGIHNTIGKLINVKEDYAKAIEIALGASVNFIVVQNEQIAKEAIQFLKENRLGRATFFPLNTIKERFIPEEALTKLKNNEGFIGVASDLINYEKTYEAIIKNQLGQVLVVKTIDDMTNISKLMEHKYRVVTLEGDIMHVGGSLTGGKSKENSSLNDRNELEKIKRTLEETNNENEKLKIQLNQFEDKLKELEIQEEQLNRKVIHLRESKKEKESFLNAKKEKQRDLSKELEGAESLQNGNVDQKLMALLELVNEAEKKKNKLEANLEFTKNEKSELTEKIEILEKEFKQKNSEYNKLQTELKNKEMELVKMDTKLDSLLISLNESYNLTYEQAKISYILELDKEIAQEQVKHLKNEIHKLGNVNLFAIDEYERVKVRFDFLNNQKEDLENSNTHLREIIKEMDTIMIEKFSTTFTKINEEFQTIFRKMFKGGNGLLKLTDPENLLETGIEIMAVPPGKKLSSVGPLSGGEKTLTAISLLFAIMNVKTVPFCILDEVEAALDEANVDAFGKYLQEFKHNSQFILITHKKRTMEYADNLYGITMQEKGVSKIVSVSLEKMET